MTFLRKHVNDVCSGSYGQVVWGKRVFIVYEVLNEQLKLINAQSVA